MRWHFGIKKAFLSPPLAVVEQRQSHSKGMASRSLSERRGCVFLNRDFF